MKRYFLTVVFGALAVLSGLCQRDWSFTWEDFGAARHTLYKYYYGHMYQNGEHGNQMCLNQKMVFDLTHLDEDGAYRNEEYVTPELLKWLKVYYPIFFDDYESDESNVPVVFDEDPIWGDEQRNVDDYQLVIDDFRFNGSDAEMDVRLVVGDKVYRKIYKFKYVGDTWMLDDVSVSANPPRFFKERLQSLK